MKKRKKESSRYHCCSNVWNNEDSNAFSIKLWKKKKMVKVGYFCMGQKMMWDNVVNLSDILCQQIQLCKLYK